MVELSASPPPGTTLRLFGRGVAGLQRPRQAGRQPARRRAKDPPIRCLVSDDPKYQLSDDDWQWVARTVDSLGPLTDRQRDILALLLRKRC